MPWPGGLQFVVQMALSPSAGGGVWDSAQWDVDSWGGSEPSWVTITDDVLSVTTTQGRQTFDERFATGVMSVVLNNVDGKYTPDFGAPPPGQLTLRPGRWMRLGVYQLQDPVPTTDPVPAATTWNDDTVRPWESFGDDVTVTRDVQVPAEIRVLFVGYIDTLDDAHFQGGSDTEMTVTCFDLAATFAMANPAPLLTPVGAGETTGDRVTRILDSAGWLTGPEYRDIQPGAHTLQETTLANNYLFEAQEAARSELGGFFFDGTVATFKQFGWLSTDPRSTTVQSFPGRGLAGDPLVVAADPFWSAQVIRNDYQLTRLGQSVPVTSFSGISKQLYGERSYVYASYLNDNDPDLQAVADALLESLTSTTINGCSRCR